MSFSKIVSDGIEKIYNEDLESQKFSLSVVTREIRFREEIRPLLKAKAIFVPNSGYIRKYFGEQSLDPAFDLYNWQGICLWDNFVLFPVWNVVNQIVGLAGFDPISKAKSLDGERDSNLPKYKYSNSTIFERSKYLYFLPGAYDKCVEEGYAVVSDGMFDTIYFDHEGFNSLGLLGSTLSKEVLFQLRFVKHLFVAMDNDEAGYNLYRKLSRMHPSVFYVRQNVGGDGDDILKSEYREAYVEKLWDAIRTKSSITFRAKPIWSV